MSETPHLTHLTLNDDEFRILNSFYTLGLGSARGASPYTLLLLTLHLHQLVSDLGWDAIYEFTKKLDDLGAANPNFDSTPVTF